MTKTTPHVKFHHHNDYLISFYAGRDQAKRHLEERNWLDDSALKLGTAMYAIHSGAEAIVYDTFASMAHAEFVRYLREIGSSEIPRGAEPLAPRSHRRQRGIRRRRHHRHFAHA